MSSTETEIFLLRESILRTFSERYPIAGSGGPDAFLSAALGLMEEKQLHSLARKMRVEVKPPETSIPKKAESRTEPIFRVDDIVKIAPNPDVSGNPDNDTVKFILKYGQWWKVKHGHRDAKGVKRHLFGNLTDSLKVPKAKRRTLMRDEWIQSDPSQRDFHIVEVIETPKRYEPKQHGYSAKEFS